MPTSQDTIKQVKCTIISPKPSTKPIKYHSYIPLKITVQAQMENVNINTPIRLLVKFPDGSFSVFPATLKQEDSIIILDQDIILELEAWTG